MEEFIAYLYSKHIDAEAFKIAEPDTYTEWAQMFSQVSPKSFTAQKLYLINPIRRRFHYDPPAEEKPKASAQPKPAMKPKTTGSNSDAPRPKPAMKPKMAENPATSKTNESDAGEVKKLKVAKPVMKPKMPASKPEGERKAAPKPVMKPKIPQKDDAEGKTEQKPKPVMKPKIPKRKEEGESKAAPKPVMKPKIPPRKDSD